MPRQVAQLNLARLREPLSSPRLAPFLAALDQVNAAADAAPGFVWRLADESGNATAVRPWDADVIVNLSVWASLESLQAYVYGAVHLAVLRRRRDWFTPLAGPHLVVWWVPVGHRPTLAEAGSRLAQLASAGASSAAFTLAQPFPAPQ